MSKSRWPLPFAKYSGAGNDFIILDARDGEPAGDPSALAKALCRRGRSVGADGLIVVEATDVDDTDSLARMRLWNADGSEAEISGNGARCVARFLVDGGAEPEMVRFDSDVGPITAQVDGDMCRLQLPTRARVFPSCRLRVEGRDLTGTYVEVGVPFFVCFHDNPDELAVRFIGRAVRNHAALAPRGANVDFVRVEDEQRLYFRVYERGVEDETLSSGTGSISAALAAAAAGRVASPVLCVARGAELTVRYRRIEAGGATGSSASPDAPHSSGASAGAAGADETPKTDADDASASVPNVDGPTAELQDADESQKGIAGDATDVAPGAATDAIDDDAGSLPSLLDDFDPAACIEFVDLEVEGDAMPIFRGEATVQASRGPRRS